MGVGIMEMAKAGQAVCITPFTLSGAMAPVTIPGALVQQHAEFMVGLCLAQAARALVRKSFMVALQVTWT